MLISNQLNDTFNKLIDSLDNGSNIEVLAELMQIYMSNNNILGSGKREKSLDKKKNFLKNWL